MSAKRFASSRDLAVEMQRLLDQPRNLDQPLHQPALAFRVGAVELGERDHEHAERRELRRERLGRRDADLRAGARQQHELRFAHERALGHVADRQARQVAGLLGHAQRRERVGRLARLRDRDEQRVLRHDGIAIAILARDLDPARQARDLLDVVLRDGAGVIARAARDDLHRLGATEHFGGQRSERGFQQLAAGDALFERLRDRARLLVDLLEHVVRRSRPSPRHRPTASFRVTGRCAVLPSLSRMRTLWRRISATSPSSRKMNWRVTGSSAETSEATKFSLLPMPITTGQPARASTIVSGESCDSTASAYAPSSSATVARTARNRSPSFCL